MRYNLNKIRKLIMDVHPELGNISFYLDHSFDMVESIGCEDIKINVPKRFGVNVLGRPELTINEIETFQGTMRYMGFEPYYFDYDKWGMLFFEFSLGDGDEVYMDIGAETNVL